MKNLDLNAYGVSEMDTQEMIGVNGGILPIIGVGLLIKAVVTLVAAAVATEIIMNPSDVSKTAEKGFNDGYNAVK